MQKETYEKNLVSFDDECQCACRIATFDHGHLDFSPSLLDVPFSLLGPFLLLLVIVLLIQVPVLVFAVPSRGLGRPTEIPHSSPISRIVQPDDEIVKARSENDEEAEGV